MQRHEFELLEKIIDDLYDVYEYELSRKEEEKPPTEITYENGYKDALKYVMKAMKNFTKDSMQDFLSGNVVNIANHWNDFALEVSEEAIKNKVDGGFLL